MKSSSKKRVFAFCLSMIMILSMLSNSLVFGLSEESERVEQGQTTLEADGSSREEMIPGPQEEQASGFRPEQPEQTESEPDGSDVDNGGEEFGEIPETEYETYGSGDATPEDLEEPREAEAGEFLRAGEGEYSTDLKDYITSITIKKGDSNGTYTEVPSGTAFSHGDQMLVEFNWTIPGDVYGDNKIYTYQLPVNFQIDSAVTEAVTQGGTVIGSFTVDTDGLVTLTYNDDYNTENNQTVNSMGIKGSAKFIPEDSENEGEFIYKDFEETFVVINPGEFTVQKDGVKVLEDNKHSDTSKIRYTVTIDSDLGTEGDFIITDVLTKQYYDNDLGWERAHTGDKFESTIYDPDSFQITDKDGNPVNGWSVSVNGDRFTISNVPELPAKGSYTLTYTLDVKQKTGDTERLSIKNTVKVKNPDHELEKSKTIVYERKITKSFVEYDRSKGFRWRVVMKDPDRTLAGLTFTDTATAPITGLGDIRVVAFDSGYHNLGITRPPITLSEDGKTFSFVIPDVENAIEWRVEYYTEVAFEDGVDRVETHNTATISRPDTPESWSGEADGVGESAGIAIPIKRGIGYEENGDGTVSFNWNMDISYMNLNRTTLVIMDQIQAAQRHDYYEWHDGYINTYASDHYGIANQIQEDLEDSTTGLVISIKNEDGSTQDLTYSQAVAAGYKITVYYYVSQNNPVNPVAGTDTSRHIKEFRIHIEHPNDSGELQNLREIERVQVGSYRTVFSKEHYNAGEEWRMNNDASSLWQKDSDTLTYETERPEMSKMVSAMDSSGRYVWTDQPSLQDYDKIKGTLTYRIQVKVPAGTDSVTITDILPEGYTLAGYNDIFWSDDFKVGPSTGSAIFKGDNQYWNNWLDSHRRNYIQLEEPSEENGNTMKVTVNRLGRYRVSDGGILRLRDPFILEIRYNVKIDPNFERLESAVRRDTENAIRVQNIFTNRAGYGDLESSVDVPIIMKKEVLNKTGQQVEEDGKTTSKVHYAIEINKPAMDILENGDTLTLTDMISSNTLDFELDRSSIHLYYMNQDGSRGEEAEPEMVKINGKEEDASGLITQSFEMRVQDETAYILEYDYNVIAARQGTSGKLDNTVELAGIVKSSDNTEVRGVTAWAISDQGALRIYKVDAIHNTKFISAVFRLEKYDKATDKFVTVEDDFEIGGSAGKVYQYFIDNGILDGNTLYRLVELEAQSGYINPEIPTYFIVKGNIESVRGTGNSTLLVISTDEEAKTAAFGSRTSLTEENVRVGELDIHMLAPNRSLSIDIENEHEPIHMPQTGSNTRRNIMIFSCCLLASGVMLMIKRQERSRRRIRKN